MNIGVWIIVSILLVCACWTDLRRLQIPNSLTILFAVGGMLYHLFILGLSGFGWSIAGVLSGLLPLYVMHRLGGMGGGDVKWFGAFGAWAGPALTFQLLMYSVLIAGGIACLLLMLRIPGLRTIGSRLKWPWGNHPVSGGKGVHFPFMLAVAPGFMTLLGKG